MNGLSAYQIAYEHARKHAEENTRCAHIGACLLINGKLHDVKCNSRDGHAEMSVLRSYSTWFNSLLWFAPMLMYWIGSVFGIRRGPTLDIVIVRVRKDGTTGNAKPCTDCLPVLKRCSIRYVFYTTGIEDGKMMVERACDMSSDHRCKAKPPAVKPRVNREASDKR